MSRLKKLVSFWAFVAFAALILLQISPIPGIYLMFLGGPFLAGLALQLFLLSLAAEAITRRIPLPFLLLPLMAYGGYYALYISQSMTMARTSAELRATNSGKVLDFDPQTSSLVTPDAQDFVESHKIPVVYSNNSYSYIPDKYLSFRLVSRAQCRIPRDSQSRVVSFGVRFEGAFQRQLCLLRFPQDPPHKLVTVVDQQNRDKWRASWGISEDISEARVDGKTIGTFKTASIWRLSFLPMPIIGCFLIDNPSSWKCGADLYRSLVKLDGIPSSVDPARYDSPASVMLGIRKYTAADLADFSGYDTNASALKAAAQIPKQVQDNAFDMLQDILNGQDQEAPFGMGYSLAQNPTRLAPLAQDMAKRFIQMNVEMPPPICRLSKRLTFAERHLYHSQWLSMPSYARADAEALQTAIVALPKTAFAKVADSIFDFIQGQECRPEKYPLLYVRAADAGQRTFPFYKGRFFEDAAIPAWRTQPVLAICRIGQADAETITAMKQRFIDAPGQFNDDTYRSALFVTLLKLGEEKFLRENFKAMPAELATWADAVLAKKGMTDEGPNNCVGESAPSFDYPVAMKPSLQRFRDGWIARASL